MVRIEGEEREDWRWGKGGLRMVRKMRIEDEEGEDLGWGWLRMRKGRIGDKEREDWGWGWERWRRWRWGELRIRMGRTENIQVRGWWEWGGNRMRRMERKMRMVRMEDGQDDTEDWQWEEWILTSSSILTWWWWGKDCAGSNEDGRTLGRDHEEDNEVVWVMVKTVKMSMNLTMRLKTERRGW